MVRVAGRRLHLPAEQQRVLLRHQQLAVVGNRRPAAPLHQRRVRRLALRRALLLNLPDLAGGDFPAVVFLQTRQPLVRREWLAGNRDLSLRKPRQSHADQARHDAVVETVPRALRHAALALDPARPPPPRVSFL